MPNNVCIFVHRDVCFKNLKVCNKQIFLKNICVIISDIKLQLANYILSFEKLIWKIKINNYELYKYKYEYNMLYKYKNSIYD